MIEAGTSFPQSLLPHSQTPEQEGDISHYSRAVADQQVAGFRLESNNTDGFTDRGVGAEKLDE
jgi:hypothetical protein